MKTSLLYLFSVALLISCVACAPQSGCGGIVDSGKRELCEERYPPTEPTHSIYTKNNELSNDSSLYDPTKAKNSYRNYEQAKSKFETQQKINMN